MTFGEDQGTKEVATAASLLALFTLNPDDGSCPIVSLTLGSTARKALEAADGYTYEALGVAARTDPMSGISVNTQYDPAAGEEANDFVHDFYVIAETENAKSDSVQFQVTIHSCFNVMPVAVDYPARRRLVNGAENPDYTGPTFTRGPFELILGGSPVN